MLPRGHLPNNVFLRQAAKFLSKTGKYRACFVMSGRLETDFLENLSKIKSV